MEAQQEQPMHRPIGWSHMRGDAFCLQHAPQVLDGYTAIFDYGISGFRACAVCGLAVRDASREAPTKLDVLMTAFEDEQAREAAILEQEEEAQGMALREALADLRAMSDLFLDAKATIEEGLAMAGEARRKLGETGPEPTEDFPRPYGVLKAEARAHAERVHVPGRMFVR